MKYAFSYLLVFLLHHTYGGNKNHQGQDTPEDFETLLKKHVEENYPFVDKTPFIREFLPSSKLKKGNIITRPPRWGKSINLHMLDIFLSIETDERGNKKPMSKNKLLFSEGEFQTVKGEKKKYPRLKISNYSDAMIYQGVYPTLYIDFSMVSLPFKNSSSTLEKFIYQFSAYIKHMLNTRYPCLKKYYDNSSQVLNENCKDRLKRYFNGTLNRYDFPYTIALIVETLYKHFNNTPVYLLIDNYDSIYNRLFIKLGGRTKLFAQIFHMFMEMFDLPFKKPYISYIEKTLLTGVSALNLGELSQKNMYNWHTVRDEKFAEYYGFSHTEVQDLLLQASLSEDKKNEIKLWYNGYSFETLYNPFSVTSCIRANGVIQSYWNGSTCAEVDNYVKNIIKKLEVRESIIDLNDMKSLYCRGSHYIDFFARYNNFPMLLNYGLVTTSAKSDTSGGLYYKIPNREIKLIYERELKEALAPTTTTKDPWEKFEELQKLWPD